MERKLLKNLDFVMIAVTMAIMVFGIVAIRSATAPSLYYVKRQLLNVVLGWVAAAVIVTSDYSGWSRYSGLLYGFNLLQLLAVRLVGHEALGAQRWIKLGPLGQYQPSEFAKIIMIITLATSLSRRERITTWPELFAAMAHILPPLMLVLIQPDLGTSLVFVAILVGMLFMAGAPVKKLLLLFGGGLAAAVSVVLVQLKFHLQFPLKDYQLKRLIVLVNPEADPTGAGYHVLQSKIAIGSGGPVGKGLFFGTQTQLSFLPERHTDFIFSVIGEELGFIGAVALLALFLILLVRAVRVAGDSKDLFGTLLATGVTSMLAFHLLINVGMTMGIMPVTGIPLPFVSYGGSPTLSNAMGIGILLDVYMRRQKILF